MIDQKYIDLMNTEIDGVNTENESRELDTYLESNAEAREYFEELRATTKTIDSVPAAEAPPGLYHRVMSQLPHPASPTPYPAPGGIGDWLRGLFARPQIRLATSFAAGLAIGVAVYSALTGDDSFRRPLDLDDIAGTMATIESRNGFEQIADLGVSTTGVSGYVHVHRSGETVIADVMLESNREIEWSLEYDGTEVTLDGFRQLAGPGDFVSTSNGTRATLDGENRYVLLFRARNGAPSPMTLRVYSGGAVVFEEVIAGQ